MRRALAAVTRWRPLPLAVFVLGFGTFLVSFGQRAVVVEKYPLSTRQVEGGITVESVSGPISGWPAAKRHRPTWPLNLALAHLPIVFSLMLGFGMRRLRWVGALVAGAAFCGQATIGLFPSMNHITELCTGYWLWTFSSLLMGGAFVLVSRGGTRDPRDRP